MSFRALFPLAVFILLARGSALAEEAKKIQDNSFLIEEAYNQEPGVVQHIQGFQYMKEGTWAYSFTQEWPFSGQVHQLSYTIPVNHHASSQETGIGDVALNYRYQVACRGPIALAPRLSLLLPTGDYKKGFGSGALGLQVNIPLSVELSNQWVTHWNGGFTLTPDSKGVAGGKADALGFNYGASLIWVKPERFNLMLEVAWSSTESVQPDGSTMTENTFFLSPGARFAINYKSGLQLVYGIGIPVGIGPSEGEHGVFLYLSLEHPFSKKS